MKIVFALFVMPKLQNLSLLYGSFQWLRQEGKQILTGDDYYGTRYDMGNKMGIMKANCEVALNHPEIGEDFKAYIKALAETL